MQAEHELLITEYNHSVEVANHIDNVRNVITSFFLTLNGGVLVLVSLVVKGEVRENYFGPPKALLSGLLLAVFRAWHGLHCHNRTPTPCPERTLSHSKRHS